mgnify:CR=1 FL=1|jgi:RNA polymerase subunit RPABC4/transcription elongation factor Spt4
MVMYICKNCNKVHESFSITCPTCKMRGMLIEYFKSIVNIDEKELNTSHLKCKNCGNKLDNGESQCSKCKFPIGTSLSFNMLNFKGINQ